MTDRIEFVLDGKTVSAEPGETIWTVAKREGTKIPNLCHVDMPGYRPDGNCRACMVEIKGERVLAAVAPGVLAVPKNRRARRQREKLTDRGGGAEGVVGFDHEVRLPAMGLLLGAPPRHGVGHGPVGGGVRLLAAVEGYFELMYDNDVLRFDQVFAPSAQLHGLRDGHLRLLPAQDYRNALASGPSPKAKSAPRHQEILLLDFASAA